MGVFGRIQMASLLLSCSRFIPFAVIQACKEVSRPCSAEIDNAPALERSPASLRDGLHCCGNTRELHGIERICSQTVIAFTLRS
jgi:hypothetical protein